MNRKLVIIGARAFGRETCNYAREAGFDVVGFLDDKADALSGFDGYPPVLGAVEAYEVLPGDQFVCAVGEPRWREKYAKIIEAKGGTFVNVIHPTAYVGRNVKMGVGCIICPLAVVDCDLSMGNHVDINGFAYVPHDCALEDYVTVSPGCRIGGRTTLHRSVFLGLGVTIIPDMEIGAGAYVAAGAVVTRNVPPGVLVAGVPAVIKRELANG